MNKRQIVWRDHGVYDVQKLWEITKTIKDFVPSEKITITYVEENRVQYENKDNNYLEDEASVILNFYREGKELNNNTFDRAIVIE